MSDLDYDHSGTLRSNLTLQSGRRIWLKAIDQSLTYSGLLEGSPDARANEVFMQWALSAAAKHCLELNPIHLLPPERRTEPPNERGRVTEWLPRVQCIATFGSTKVRDPDKCTSELTVVWFQHDFAMPIDDRALAQLRALDWDALATDVEIS
jgi:hypothetical protein